MHGDIQTQQLKNMCPGQSHAAAACYNVWDHGYCGLHILRWYSHWSIQATLWPCADFVQRCSLWQWRAEIIDMCKQTGYSGRDQAPILPLFCWSHWQSFEATTWEDRTSPLPILDPTASRLIRLACMDADWPMVLSINKWISAKFLRIPMNSSDFLGIPKFPRIS